MNFNNKSKQRENIISATKQNTNKVLFFFLTIWLLINLIQSIFTPINADEAYYAMYGEHLAWGYFDHPPMVGIITYLSSLFFHGHLSVRFLTPFLQVICVYVIWKLTGDKEPTRNHIKLFFIITASFVMLNAYGFITTPDVPLLLFSALFLLIYQSFINKTTTLNTILLGVVMACMVYSKYHAVLVIGFTILSNLKLLKKSNFWVAGILALVLLIPHILWQVNMDFPSIKYHMVSRSLDFKWIFFFEYLPNQLVTFNPFTFGAFCYIIFKTKPESQFEKTLYFISIGFILFFWLMAFKGHVEPHWTMVASIPMVILIYKRTLHSPPLQKYTKRFILPSVFLILIIRIVLASGLVNIPNFHKAKNYKAIEQVAQNLPVVFTGSFQDPSLYHYFTGKESFTLSSVFSRQTQFDIWQKELNYYNQPAFIVSDDPNRATVYDIDGVRVSGYKVAHLQTTNRVNIKVHLTGKEVSIGDTLYIPFTMYHKYFDIDFHHTEFPVTFKVFYLQKQKTFLGACQLDTPIDKLPANQEISGTITTVVPADLAEGEYQFGIGLDNGINLPANSNILTVKIN